MLGKHGVPRASNNIPQRWQRIESKCVRSKPKLHGA
jgi:hypothetical protein